LKEFCKELTNIYQHFTTLNNELKQMQEYAIVAALMLVLWMEELLP
jgi:hypothetical protein